MTTTIQDILTAIRAYAPDADVRPVWDAYLLAAHAHEGQTRKSGEAYLHHPLEVAHILTDLRMDVDTVATGLLHDVLEDHPITKDELAAKVGPVIAGLVDGVTKIGKLTFRSREEHQAENFRKMMIAMSRDLRVILVKLADRLHNMRTLDGHGADKRVQIARETIEVFAPIANRLGLSPIKTELEDLSLAQIEPEAFGRIASFLAETQADREAYVARVCRTLEDELVRRGVQATVSGRAKSITSIHRKVGRSGTDAIDLPDLLAFRVLVPTKADCYTAIGHVHEQHAPVPGRFKDYVARPKPNGYQSLHTTVIGPEGRRIEVQVRTPEMHRVAEDGVAAHWKYKEGHLALPPEEIVAVARIREAFENAQDATDASDFMEMVKVAFYADEVFVFTPAGEVKSFPKGATPIDFAYAVHSRIGETCTGARVNGRLVPLDHVLRSGETVEIVTSPHQKPRRDWLDIARTPSAIAKIRRYLRLAEEESAQRVGQELLDTELARVGWTLERARTEGRLDPYLKKRGLKTLPPLHVELARGHLTVSDVAQAILPEGAWYGKQEEARRTRLASLFTRFARRSHSPVRISGEDGLLVQYAKCCHPLPGDPVVGFITRGRGITVHRDTCVELERLEEDRRIQVEWDDRHEARHSATVTVYCHNKPGMLSKITGVCEAAQVNIEKADAKGTQGPIGVVTLQLAVRNRDELARVVANLVRIPEVQHVERGVG
jgi:GTP pyrophosphokinase